MEIVNFILSNSSTFLFVFVRTSAILMSAPVFGANNVPPQMKIGLSFVIALLIAPGMPYVALPPDTVSLVVAVAGELLIGLAIGFAMKFILAGIEFAGQIASLQMGLGMATSYDPFNAGQSTVLGRMLWIITMLVFLSVNGHLMIIMALDKSLGTVAPYGFSLSPAFAENLLLISREVFVLAVKLSAPVVAVLIFINVAMGIMGRAVPQLNMFSIGFAITILVGLLMIVVSLPVFENAVRGVLDRMWEGVFGLIKVM